MGNLRPILISCQFTLAGFGRPQPFRTKEHHHNEGDAVEQDPEFGEFTQEFGYANQGKCTHYSRTGFCSKLFFSCCSFEESSTSILEQHKEEDATPWLSLVRFGPLWFLTPSGFRRFLVFSCSLFFVFEFSCSSLVFSWFH